MRSFSPLFLLFIATDVFAPPIDPGGVAGLIFGALAVFWLLVILGSLAIPFVFATGWWRLVILLPIVGFWGYQYREQFQKPEAMAKWRLTGLEQCRSESKALPNLIPTDGFLDEGVGVSDEIILALFSERQLDFVEIYFPNTNTIFRNRIELDTAKALVQPYIHLTLSKKGDPHCVRLLGAPEGKERRVPFLPDTCLTATYQNEPTARYAIRLEHAAEPESKLYGRWTLIDRVTSTPIASVTTTETRNPILGTRALYKPEDVRRLADCPSPQAVLVNRFVGTKPGTGKLTEEQLVRIESSKASIDVMKIDAPDRQLRLITVEAERAFYDAKEERLLFSQEIFEDGWKAAMDEALQRGVASFGSKLLLLPARKLISLELTGDGRGYPWEVFAVNDGFFVVRTSPSWYETDKNLIARFDRSGTFIWAVNLKEPHLFDSQCSFFSPRSIYVTTEHLVLATKCKELSYEERRQMNTSKVSMGEKWKIPLRSLPGRL